MHKIQYQVNSPYIDLLNSKKKVYGHKYDSKSATNQWRASPGSTSLFSQAKKHYKSQSQEKARVCRSQNTKKKRNNTEQAQQKLHQSLCVQLGRDQHQVHHATKSLFYGQPSRYKQDNDDPATRWTQLFMKDVIKKKIQHQNSKQTDSGALQNLQLTDIDSLINLIDHCVAQANEYISYLSQKIQGLKQQLILKTSQVINFESRLKQKIQQIQIKDKIIKKLQIQINDYKKSTKQQPYQTKKLLEVIQKLSQENQKLKRNIQQGYNKQLNNTTQIYNKNQQFYKEIHSKIDILNISIDSKKNHMDSPSKNKSDPKKYKFIKPRAR